MTLNTTIKYAYEARKNAIATRTNVGVCIYACNDELASYVQGSNFENSYKKTYHAEETALINGLLKGYRNKDFKYMVQIAFAEDEVYPCCLSCLAFLWEYTHPYFIIYTVYDGKVVHSTDLETLTSGFKDCDIYPIKKRREYYGK